MHSHAKAIGTSISRFLDPGNGLAPFLQNLLFFSSRLFLRTRTELGNATLFRKFISTSLFTRNPDFCSVLLHLSLTTAKYRRGRSKMLYRRRSTTLLIISIMVVFDHLPAVMAAAQCFGIDGQKSATAPCNSNVTGTANSHSACCDESKQEACLSSGLCYATQRSDNNTFWAEGCTDPMGRDPTCPSYCGATSQFISSKSKVLHDA